MWQWLNRNAAAIEALSSVAGVAITGALLWITSRYVRLTKILTEVATAQRKSQQDADEIRSRELHNNISRLWGILGSLPNPSERSTADRKIRGATPWDDFDFGRFSALSAEFGYEAASDAGAVANNLLWLAERKKEVTDTPQTIGYDWSQFPWWDWDKIISDTYEALARINRARTSPTHQPIAINLR